MANLDMSVYWALQDIKDNPEMLRDPFHMAVLLGYAETYGHDAAALLLSGNESLMPSFDATPALAA